MGPPMKGNGLATPCLSMPLAKHTKPTTKKMTAARAERCARFGRGGRPDNAVTTGTRAVVRAGHHAAAVVVNSANPIPAASSHHGMSALLMRWLAADSRLELHVNQPTSATPVPTTADTSPATRPWAIVTRRSCRLVAPIAASIPN